MKEEKEAQIKEALAEIPAKVMDELGIKELRVHMVASDEERSAMRYPFFGMYIEAYLKSDNATKELVMRSAIERAIGEKLSCTCSPEMSGSQKAVYRVDFEMKGIG